MIRYDATHKVRIGVTQCRHEFAQLIFVRERHRAEHALLRAHAELRLTILRHAHAGKLSYI